MLVQGQGGLVQGHGGGGGGQGRGCANRTFRGTEHGMSPGRAMRQTVVATIVALDQAKQGVRYQ